MTTRRTTTTRKPTAPKFTLGKVPTDAETPVQTGADAPQSQVETAEQTWISYTDEQGKAQRIPVSKYHEKGLG